MNASSPATAPLRAGYYFTDDAARRYKGWVAVFPLEMLWESNNPLLLGEAELIRRTQEQWAGYTTAAAWQHVGADSYAGYYAALTQTRAKTTRTLTRAAVKFRYPSTTRRYICGNVLLLQAGWQPGGYYELYAFRSEGTLVGERGYHHSLAAESMALVCSGTLPTDA